MPCNGFLSVQQLATSRRVRPAQQGVIPHQPEKPARTAKVGHGAPRGPRHGHPHRADQRHHLRPLRADSGATPRCPSSDPTCRLRCNCRGRSHCRPDCRRCTIGRIVKRLGRQRSLAELGRVVCENHCHPRCSAGQGGFVFHFNIQVFPAQALPHR